jgi:glycosyltransferase involved in cell wall biosynthesis
MFDSKDTSIEVGPSFTTVSTGLGQPEISILMPVWNCEPFIAAALTSILNQTGVLAEILISDDASSDQTYSLVLRIIEEWLRHSKPTHIVRVRKNLKRQRRHHFNQLVRHASCDIVFEAHGDDISLPGRAAILRDLFNRADLKAAMVFSEAILIDENGIILDEPSNQIKPLELALCNPEVFLEENTSLIGASMAWKKSTLSKFSVPEEVMAAAGHDRIRAFRGSLAGNVYWLSSQLYYRRLHASNLHKNSYSEPKETNNAFGRNLIRMSFFSAMKKDVKTAHDLGLVDSLLYESLLARINKNFDLCSNWLLNAFRDLTDSSHKINWVKDD